MLGMPCIGYLPHLRGGLLVPSSLPMIKTWFLSSESDFLFIVKLTKLKKPRTNLRGETSYQNHERSKLMVNRFVSAEYTSSKLAHSAHTERAKLTDVAQQGTFPILPSDHRIQNLTDRVQASREKRDQFSD